MDAFAELIEKIVLRSKVDGIAIYRKSKIELPGYYRPNKRWDLLVTARDHIAIAVEMKSQVGSFGNNFNNRIEEAIGTANDLWTAFREGAFNSSPEPWLGFLLLLEHSKASVSPVKVFEPHFNVFPEFRGSSYALRYELAGRKLVRERLYRSFALILARRSDARTGRYTEPAEDLSFSRFAHSLTAHLRMYK